MYKLCIHLKLSHILGACWLHATCTRPLCVCTTWVSYVPSPSFSNTVFHQHIYIYMFMCTWIPSARLIFCVVRLQVSGKSCDPNCHYNYTYASGSASAGHLSGDVLTLTDSTGVSTAISNFAFGCGNENKLSFQGKLSLGSQLALQYGVVFSYCLPPFSLSNNTGISTELTFGRSIAAATNLTYTGILWLPSSSYYIPMIGVSINGADLGLPRAKINLSSSGKGGVILDSSTTVTTLPTSAYNSIKKVTHYCWALNSCETSNLGEPTHTLTRSLLDA